MSKVRDTPLAPITHRNASDARVIEGIMDDLTYLGSRRLRVVAVLVNDHVHHEAMAEREAGIERELAQEDRKIAAYAKREAAKMKAKKK